MIITWWRTWWRQRGRAHHRPVRLRQRDLALENLEDRRLLSAALASDPILGALTNEKPSTADIAIVHLAVPGDAGAPDAAVVSGLAIAGSQWSLTGSDPAGTHFGPVPVNTLPAAQPGMVGSAAAVDAAFAAGLIPMSGNSVNHGRVSTAAAQDLGAGVPDGGASLTGVDPFVIDGGLASGGGSSSATPGDSGGSSIAPADSGSGGIVAAQGVAPATGATATPAGGVVSAFQQGGNQASGGTGDTSGGASGTTTTLGTDASASTARADQGVATGDRTAGDLEWVGAGTRWQSSDGGDQGGTSGGATSDDDTGAAADDGSASSGDGGKSSGKNGTRTDHSQANDQDDLGDQGTADGTSSGGAGRRHGGRARGAGRVAGAPTDQGATAPDTPDDSATNAVTSFPGDFGVGQESTGGEPAAAAPAGVALATIATGQPAAMSAGAAGRHYHRHRVGPPLVPSMSEAELTYVATDWCQVSDDGTDPPGGYFQQNCDFTTKVSNLGGFRPDGLARAEKGSALGEKADWRSLGAPTRAANETPVLIGWGNAGAALSGGEGVAEGLDLVYSFQAAAAVRGSGVTGVHHVPARAVNRQDLGSEDPGVVLAGSARFFTSRPLPPVEAGHGQNGGSWQAAAVATAEVDAEPIEHLVAGSFAARHLKSDGNGSGDSQRLDGRGWWGIVGQFILAPQFPHNHQPTIMLAVADEPSRDALNIALVKANFLVLTAATAREAMKLLRTPLSPVDVALLDVHLPDVNGVDLCSRLRELYPTLPVLVCTDQAEHGDVNQLQKLNVLRVFSKPVAIGELLAAVKGIVS